MGRAHQHDAVGAALDDHVRRTEGQPHSRHSSLSRSKRAGVRTGTRDHGSKARMRTSRAKRATSTSVQRLIANSPSASRP